MTHSLSDLSVCRLLLNCMIPLAQAYHGESLLRNCHLSIKEQTICYRTSNFFSDRA